MSVFVVFGKYKTGFCGEFCTIQDREYGPQTALDGVFIGVCPFSSLGEKISRADQTRPDKKLNSKLSHIIEILRKDNEIKDVVLK